MIRWIIVIGFVAVWTVGLSYPSQAEEHAQKSLEESFKLVFHLPQEVIKQIETRHGYIMYDMMCVLNEQQNQYLGIVIAQGGGTRHKIIFLDKNGNVYKEPQNSIKDINLIGGEGQIRYLDHQIYLGGDLRNAFLIGDSLTLVESPFLKENLQRRYPNISFQYFAPNFVDMMLFRITDQTVLTIDPKGNISEQNLATGEEKKYPVPLPLPPDKPTLDEYLVVVLYDPVIGRYGDHIFLWSRKLICYDIMSNRLTSYKIDELFAQYNIGKILRSGPNYGISYFALPETFYIFAYTDRGIYAFQYQD